MPKTVIWVRRRDYVVADRDRLGKRDRRDHRLDLRRSWLGVWRWYRQHVMYLLFVAAIVAVVIAMMLIYLGARRRA
jgi:hypothetical protein